MRCWPSSRGAEPRNEVEAALAIQMACAHVVTMAVLSRAGGAYGGNRHVAMMAAAAARLQHAFTAQVETMRRLRSGGTQVIRIERVEVKEGGQAVIGNLKAGTGVLGGQRQGQPAAPCDLDTSSRVGGTEGGRSATAG